MITYNYFIGTDVGKKTNAVCVIDALENRKLELTIPNSKAGMETLLKQLEKLPDFGLETTLFCMEYTATAFSFEGWQASQILVSYQPSKLKAVAVVDIEPVIVAGVP